MLVAQEAAITGTSLEDNHMRVNDSVNLTLPAGADPKDYNVTVTVTGSFGNTDGQSYVKPGTINKDVITVPATCSNK